MNVDQKDQYEAALADFARLMGNYYKSLIENGIPEDLAKAIMMDYQRAIVFEIKKRENDGS